MSASVAPAPAPAVVSASSPSLLTRVFGTAVERVLGPVVSGVESAYAGVSRRVVRPLADAKERLVSDTKQSFHERVLLPVREHVVQPAQRYADEHVGAPVRRLRDSAQSYVADQRERLRDLQDSVTERIDSVYEQYVAPPVDRTITLIDELIDERLGDAADRENEEPSSGANAGAGAGADASAPAAADDATAPTPAPAAAATAAAAPAAPAPAAAKPVLRSRADAQRVRKVLRKLDKGVVAKLVRMHTAARTSLRTMAAVPVQRVNAWVASAKAAKAQAEAQVHDAVAPHLEAVRAGASQARTRAVEALQNAVASAQRALLSGTAATRTRCQRVVQRVLPARRLSSAASSVASVVSGNVRSLVSPHELASELAGSVKTYELRVLQTVATVRQFLREFEDEAFHTLHEQPSVTLVSETATDFHLRLRSALQEMRDTLLASGVEASERLRRTVRYLPFVDAESVFANIDTLLQSSVSELFDVGLRTASLLTLYAVDATINLSGADAGASSRGGKGARAGGAARLDDVYGDADDAAGGSTGTSAGGRATGSGSGRSVGGARHLARSPSEDSASAVTGRDF